MTTQQEKIDITNAEGIYRAAFPAMRVFFFGFEISGDVVDVRVNQSGGSQDRSPGTCTVTLVSPHDKYVIDHNDMIALGNSRDKLLKNLEQQLKDFEESGAYLKSVAANDDSTDISTMMSLVAAGGVGPFEEETADELDKLYELSKEGGPKDYLIDWADGKVRDRIKYEVVQEKAKFRTDLDLEDVYSAFFFEDEEPPNFDLTYEYPYQEGDCIFHPNDPIRIAFRDPFNPRIWYWMFTGFVDSFSEDVGVNQEALVTISGTDVSKMARYSFVQLDTGLLDQSLKDLFKDIPGIAGTTAQTKFVPYQDIFADFTIFEILELLFYGLDTFLSSLTETTDQFIANLQPEEARAYIIQNIVSKTVEDVDKMSPEERTSLIKSYRVEKKESRFINANIPPISTPRGVVFKRKDEKFGVSAYFVGDVLDPLDDPLDAAIGEHISLGDLRRLNDILHHRVKLEDVNTMALEGAPTSSKYYSVEEVITEIGTQPDKYPVGGGRVFYVAPITLGKKLEAGALDKTVVNSVALHSEFRDRLSFLYDLAERIEFCCYATPKGDMVFEMPFYDFDTWMFDKTDDHLSNDQIAKSVKDINDAARQIETRTSESGYTSEEAFEMANLAQQRELILEGFSLEQDDEEFSYLKHFTIEKHEQLGYSNALSDQGMLTAYRVLPNLIANYQEANQDPNSRKYVYVAAPGLAPILGLRIDDGSPWGFTEGEEVARLYAALSLRRANAEARNLGIQIVPHFGMMVNRPIYWRKRNYMANLVNCQHSIVWNSGADTIVNLNQVRGWTGSLNEEKLEEFAHFGGNAPFDLSRLIFKKKKGTGSG